MVGNQVHKQYIYENNVDQLVNNQFNKENVFGRHFLILVAFGVFLAPPQTWFLDLHKVKIMWNNNLLMLLVNINQVLKKGSKNCVKSLEIITNAFFMNVEKKSIKHISKKNCCVFGGAPINSYKHDKSYFDNISLVVWL